ncbi:PREDICTED: maestro heat-like repeat-containing protein family member 9 [Condylura cristata]|uniref:maestro heat-like repeat-containing protein family member 9 n=1 Tax=Condylura cristata TaxID=143302 RepID=UPI000334634A|nr:PREDICTED: maestro heat-like repeat-containing protein family member 9 [Condylura cristata]
MNISTRSLVEECMAANINKALSDGEQEFEVQGTQEGRREMLPCICGAAQTWKGKALDTASGFSEDGKSARSNDLSAGDCGSPGSSNPKTQCAVEGSRAYIPPSESLNLQKSRKLLGLVQDYSKSAPERNGRGFTAEVTNLQILQTSLKWHHVDYTASSLLDAYSSMLSHQAMILSMNSSFVDPLLQFKSQLSIIESSFHIVFSMPSMDKVIAMGKSEDDEEDLENLYQSILNIFEDTLLVLVSKDLYKLQLLKEMITWMNEDKSYMQARVVAIISRVLSFASRKVREYTSVDAPCLGVLATELSLLCSHPDCSITQQAAFGMYHLLCIAKCQNADIAKNKTANYTKPGYHYAIPSLSDMDFLPSILKQNKSKIVQNLGLILLPAMLTDFVWSLLMRLSASDKEIAAEAATLLTLTLEDHAHKVTTVSKIVDSIYKQLRENPSHVMKQAMLLVVTLLTRTSPKKVIFQLMDYPVPADNTLILMWQAAGSESSVAPHVLKTILLILKGKPGERADSLMERRRFSMDATNMMPVAASQALCTLLPVGSYRKAVAQFFPQLLMALLLQLFYSSSLRLVTENRPCYAQDALRVLLNCSGLQEVDEALKIKNCWEQFSQALFHHHGVYLVAKTLSEYNFPQFPETLHYLYKLSVEGPRRSEDSIITIIFLTELLNNFFKDPFPEEFLVLFRNWVNDSNSAVSKLSLQKISSMAPVINKIENVKSLIIAILDAFLSKDKTVIARALLTLRKLLGKLDKVTYSSLCTRIASSYCPLMDHSNAGIRCMAIRHFGELLRDMSQYTWMLSDVIFTGLVPLILFLEDTEIKVVKACKFTLEICALELHWSTTYLLKQQNYNFEMVVLSICNNLLIFHRSCIVDLICDTLGFLRSSRQYLRKASIILIGYLAKAGGYLLLRDETQVMLEIIEGMLTDKDPVIKMLTLKTHKVIKEILHKTTSSNFKQSFRRLFNVIYVKKLKPLYYFNWTSEVNDNSVGSKEIKSDEQELVDVKYENGNS